MSGQGLCGLTQLHNLDELELTNCPSATREVCLYLRENMAHCLVVDWNTLRTERVRSYWNLLGGKETHSLSRDLLKFLQDHMTSGIFKFCNNCLAVLAFYPYSGNGRTRRPDITILHLRIHIVLLWQKTSTTFSFYKKKVSNTPPPIFHYPLFYAIPSKYFILNSSFCLFPFWQNLIYVITGNKKRKNILWVYCTAGVSDTAWW